VYPRRDVVDAIRYLDRTGCQWDALPADFPHHKLVYHYFRAWSADGTLTRMHNGLREQVRHRVEGRDRQPTAALPQVVAGTAWTTTTHYRYWPVGSLSFLDRRGVSGSAVSTGSMVPKRRTRYG
jgi:transposase